jgi:predicted nuclease of predicted toxin-antitoxin system
MRHDELFTKVNTSKLLWNKKPMLPHSILVWDLENISYKNLKTIKNRVAYSPEKLYIVTKQKLSKRNRLKMEMEGFKILDLHSGISDEKIISVMDVYSMYSNMILISSDSDFVSVAKRYLKKSNLQWIMNDRNKKRILMKMNITDKNLKITTI